MSDHAYLVLRLNNQRSRTIKTCKLRTKVPGAKGTAQSS